MAAVDKHNKLTDEFVQKLVRETDGDFASLLVVFESITLGVMLALTKRYSMKPPYSVVMIETALQRAIERFSENQNGRTQV